MPEIVLVVVCLMSLSVSAFAVARLRPRLGKDRRAALSFASPGAAVLLATGWVALHGGSLIMVPLATIAALCFAAAAVFVPTAATRFAAFERQFWAHVARHG